MTLDNCRHTSKVNRELGTNEVAIAILGRQSEQNPFLSSWEAFQKIENNISTCA
jgi:hypothetical protein